MVQKLYRFRAALWNLKHERHYLNVYFHGNPLYLVLWLLVIQVRFEIFSFVFIIFYFTFWLQLFMSRDPTVSAYKSEIEVIWTQKVRPHYRTFSYECPLSNTRPPPVKETLEKAYRRTWNMHTGTFVLYDISSIKGTQMHFALALPSPTKKYIRSLKWNFFFKVTPHPLCKIAVPSGHLLLKMWYVLMSIFRGC